MGASLRSAAAYLSECGVDEPYADAELLLSHILGVKHARIVADSRKILPEPARLKFNRFVARRGEQREPLAYILEQAEFYGYKFFVNPAVLIPRPSTETLVECALDRLPATGTFLDLGTGCGAIAITILKRCRRAMAVASDISPEAIAVAERNARRHGVDGRTVFQEGNLFAPLGDDSFDLIVSNPPYVAENEYAGLAPEVKHEPKPALVGGADGLAVIKRILSVSKHHLVEGGRLLLEIGHKHATRARELALRSGFRNVEFYKDLDGIDRVLDAW